MSVSLDLTTSYLISTLILFLTLLACALKIVVNKRRLAVWPASQMRGSSNLVFRLPAFRPPSHLRIFFFIVSSSGHVLKNED
jgi:hypothetical protein